MHTFAALDLGGVAENALNVEVFAAVGAVVNNVLSKQGAGENVVGAAVGQSKLIGVVGLGVDDNDRNAFVCKRFDSGSGAFSLGRKNNNGIAALYDAVVSEVRPSRMPVHPSITPSSTSLSRVAVA